MKSEGLVIFNCCFLMSRSDPTFLIKSTFYGLGGILKDQAIFFGLGHILKVWGAFSTTASIFKITIALFIGLGGGFRFRQSHFLFSLSITKPHSKELATTFYFLADPLKIKIGHFIKPPNPPLPTPSYSITPLQNK